MPENDPKYAEKHVMDRSNLAAALTKTLELALPPIALAFRDGPPPGVAVTDAVVPSACAFWRHAETGVFFAPAERHATCPIGAFVMGFELSEPTVQELQELVGRMTACGYVHADEPGAMPVDQHGAKGILYGPLAEFPEAPDVVLLWLTPSQAMIWGEASGGARWGGPEANTVFGRPACAAIPASLNGGRPTLSFGCIGMRTFTGIPADRMLAVIPGARLVEFSQAAAQAASLNETMGTFYRERLEALRPMPSR